MKQRVLRVAAAAVFSFWVGSDRLRASAPVEKLIARLQSSAPAIRVRAAGELGRLGERSAVPALIGALASPHKDLRREAAGALGALRDPRAVPALIRALDDPAWNVRFYAASALGEINDARAAAALLEALSDPEWNVRDQAAWALRKVRDPAVIKGLVDALAAPEADVQHIVWILKAFAPEQVLPVLGRLVLSRDATVRLRALTTLAGWNAPETRKALEQALNDSDARIRKFAVDALAGIGGDDGLGTRFAALAKADPDPAVRDAALNAARRLMREHGLAAYWSFEDPAGSSTVRDVSGGGNDGRNRGCVAVPGKVGRALLFTKGRYVELGQPPGLPVARQPFTIMAWARSNTPTGVVVARGGAWSGFSLYFKDGIPKFGIHRLREGPTYIAAATAKAVGAWVHLAGVVKKDRIELYVNGRLAATAKTKGLLPNNCGQGMEIGFDAANSPAEITDNFEGVIDEVKVYQRALTPAEISKELSGQSG